MKDDKIWDLKIALSSFKSCFLLPVTNYHTSYEANKLNIRLFMYHCALYSLYVQLVKNGFLKINLLTLLCGAGPLRWSWQPDHRIADDPAPEWWGGGVGRCLSFGMPRWALVAHEDVARLTEVAGRSQRGSAGLGHPPEDVPRGPAVGAFHVWWEWLGGWDCQLYCTLRHLRRHETI